MRDELARESLAMARRIGDDRTLALVLNAYRFCLRATTPAEEALALSTEAVMRAEASGDASLANEVRVWKIADALQNEDVGTVDRERRRLRDESALLQEAWHQVFVLRYEATWALMQGRFDEAEPKIAAALQAGEKVGDGISSLVFWVQMLVLRREQGAFLDLEPVGLQIVATMPWNPAWKATLALMYAESGRLDEAHRFFGELAADRFALPPDMNELVSLAQLAETCAILGEREHAKALRDLLAPHAARTIIIAAAIASFGPVAYYLGLLDLARGARTEAVAQFEDGIRRSQRLGAEAWRIRCAEGLARALWESKSRRDRERGIGVLAEVIAAASDRLMTGLLESSRRADTKLFDAASARQRERATKGPATR